MIKTLIILTLTLIQTISFANAEDPTPADPHNGYRTPEYESSDVQSLTLFAGEGLTNTALFANNINSGGPQFLDHGFILGFEYSHRIGPTPFSMNATFVTNDSFLLGVGFDILPFVRVTGKGGYGLNNKIQNPDYGPPNTENQYDYGWIGAVGGELKLSSSFGLSTNYISNKSILGGVSFHW
jgi:hypothetical protein